MQNGDWGDLREVGMRFISKRISRAHLPEVCHCNGVIFTGPKLAFVL